MIHRKKKYGAKRRVVQSIFLASENAEVSTAGSIHGLDSAGSINSHMAWTLQGQYIHTWLGLAGTIHPYMAWTA